jgi:hypothetical protein
MVNGHRGESARIPGTIRHKSLRYTDKNLLDVARKIICSLHKDTLFRGTAGIRRAEPGSRA